MTWWQWGLLGAVAWVTAIILIVTVWSRAVRKYRRD